MERSHEGGDQVNDYLFEPPIKDSPRLAWMKNHCIKVMPNIGGAEDREWRATTYEGMVAAEGHTPDDAIFRLAKLLQIPLWNEETLAAK